MSIDIVYYSAPWCAPCKKLWPRVEQLARERGLPIERVDISDKIIPGILSVPTIRVYADDELVYQGADDRSLRMFLEEGL